MKKLHRRRCLDFLAIVTTLVLVAAAPAGALAATEESSGPTPGETVVEVPGSVAPPAAGTPPSTGWTPQGTGTVPSGGKAAPVRHGSSVGSGGVPGGAEPTSEEEPSFTPESSADAPEPSTQPATPTPSTIKEPMSKPETGGGSLPVEPTAKPNSVPNAASVALDDADPLASSQSPPSGDASETPVPVALTSSDDQAGSGSLALPLLVFVVVGLILGYAGVRLRRRHRRRRMEDLLRHRDATWKALIRRIEMERALNAPKPSSPQEKIARSSGPIRARPRAVDRSPGS